MLAHYMLSLCVCECESVTYQYCVKMAYKGSRKQHKIAQGHYFSGTKGLGEIHIGSPTMVPNAD